MTSSPHGPYAQGYTRATMGDTEGSEAERWSKSQKVVLSSDWSLQLDSMKLESLVIADQQCRGEYVPGPCTHRPSHHGSRLYQKSLGQPVREAGAEGMSGDWGEVVTRYPYRKVRMDHLLSKRNLSCIYLS